MVSVGSEVEMTVIQCLPETCNFEVMHDIAMQSDFGDGIVSILSKSVPT